MTKYITILNCNELIEGVEIPQDIKNTTPSRGSVATSTNIKYEEDTNTLSIICSGCGKWFDLYKLENGQWTDLNTPKSRGKQLKWSKKDTPNQYFFGKCYKCYDEYRNKDKDNEPDKEPEQEAKEVKEIKKPTGKSLTKEERNQKTVFLDPENDMYLTLIAKLNGEKINDMLNIMIDEFKANHPFKNPFNN